MSSELPQCHIKMLQVHPIKILYMPKANRLNEEYDLLLQQKNALIDHKQIAINIKITIKLFYYRT